MSSFYKCKHNCFVLRERARVWWSLARPTGGVYDRTFQAVAPEGGESFLSANIGTKVKGWGAAKGHICDWVEYSAIIFKPKHAIPRDIH